MALQEVIIESYQQLLDHPDIQRDWIVTDCEFGVCSFAARRRVTLMSPLTTVTDIAERSKIWYGTMLLVRRTWLQQQRFDRVDASFTRYDSDQQRSLLALELRTADGVSVSLTFSPNHPR